MGIPMIAPTPVTHNSEPMIKSTILAPTPAKSHNRTLGVIPQEELVSRSDVLSFVQEFKQA
jgi:hypothetical protein